MTYKEQIIKEGKWSRTDPELYKEECPGFFKPTWPKLIDSECLIPEIEARSTSAKSICEKCWNSEIKESQ